MTDPYTAYPLPRKLSALVTLQWLIEIVPLKITARGGLTSGMWVKVTFGTGEKLHQPW